MDKGRKKEKLDVRSTGVYAAVCAIMEKMEEIGIIGKNNMSSDDLDTIGKKHHTVHWKEKTDITKARVLVSGGRGIGSADFYDELQKLAELLGGEVSSSRANVVAGWIDSARQVGNTGNRVTPELYLACGISGTDQHKAGMDGAKCIIAINSSPTAPMFNIADLSVIGNVKIIVPELIDALKRYKVRECH
ncbi:MAG: electron transfer flavoprotein subunit alpha/FixB family protein [Bacillota bacterium]|nr:electron transfer flavoprotein subunit alpha/FixB family protein [Bacillota bacterium]